MDSECRSLNQQAAIAEIDREVEVSGVLMNAVRSCNGDERRGVNGVDDGEEGTGEGSGSSLWDDAGRCRRK